MVKREGKGRNSVETVEEGGTDTETQRRILTRARPEDFNSIINSVNPSPKKQPRVVLSPESLSRKRTRLEDQLSDIQYIDCSTPDNIVSTTAVVHPFPESPVVKEKQLFNESYQPKNKSPRNSDNIDKRQSLNLEPSPKPVIPKSFTEMDISRKYLGPNSILTTPTPCSPGYKQLGESSANTTPGSSPKYEDSPVDSAFHIQNEIRSPIKTSPNYENVLTTISITYKSPPRSLATSPIKSPITNLGSVYESAIPNPEKVIIPTSTASLPIQEASQPNVSEDGEFLHVYIEERPKSLGTIEELTSSKDSTLKANLSSSAVCNTSEQLSLGSFNDQKTISSNQSSGSNIQYTPSISSAPYHCIENSEQLSPTDLSLSEVVESSTENLTTSHTSLSFPMSPSKNSMSPNVSPTPVYDCSLRDLLTPVSPTENKTSEGLSTENLDTLPIELDSWLKDRPTSISLIEFSPVEPPADITLSPSKHSMNNDKRKSDVSETLDDNTIYQQVKYFRRSIHEVNALLDLDNGYSTSQKDNSIENVYEDVVTISDSLETSNENSKLGIVGVKDEVSDETYDSLETDTHVYENVDTESLHNENVYEDVKNGKEKTETLAEGIEEVQLLEEKIPVRELANRFEEKDTARNISKINNEKTCAPSENTVLRLDVEKTDSNLTEESTNVNNTYKLKKFYEKRQPPALPEGEKFEISTENSLLRRGRI
ncbi:hypothetical protein NQ317_012998 [Molorchus minor]|uniref:Uncharacterized protein n=1 Tax=Molorchus minor TaxID=1323400 RepID=A0ABQ9J9X6_9CUCU|nr:hypothetical protein NQ317_012998 [Molorchus minor]